MRQIKITFESGDSVIANLIDNKTADIVYQSLPLESTVVHSRWSGREVNLNATLIDRPTRENQTIYTSIGDLCYWRDWRGSEETTNHVIAIYYGAELARSNIGDEPVNVFGGIIHSDFDVMKKIGERIWL